MLIREPVAEQSFYAPLIVLPALALKVRGEITFARASGVARDWTFIPV
jgi:hypothetical protein